MPWPMVHFAVAVNALSTNEIVNRFVLDTAHELAGLLEVWGKKHG